MIKAETIQEILEKNNIVEVVGAYTTLKKKGKIYFGLCPFHKEKTPSFSVDEEKQLFHCFGCGAGGDLIHFIRKMENENFVEAVKHLGDRVGIDVEADEYDGKRSRIYDMNRIAASFYNDKLKAGGNKGNEYIKERQITEESVKDFCLGYADNSGDLSKHLMAKGFSKNEIIEASLGRETNGIMHDFFYNRLMFPIFDIKSRVVAFSGRTIDNDTRKYVNSGSTPVFKKSDIVYGLPQSIESKKESVLIVEGLMDVITLRQGGIKSVVATLGTSFTDSHFKLLSKKFKNIYVCFDSDEAGFKSAIKFCKEYIQYNEKCRIVTYSGKDPDEHIKEYGKDSFFERIRKAEKTIDFMLRLKTEACLACSTNEEKIKLIEESLAFFRSISEVVVRQVVIADFAERLGLNKNELIKKAEDDIAVEGKKQHYKQDKVKKEYLSNPTHENERSLINIFCNFPEAAVYFNNKSDLEKSSIEIIEPLYLRLIKNIVEFITSNPSPANVKQYIIFNHVKENEEFDKIELSEIIMSDFVSDLDYARKMVDDNIFRLRLAKMENDIRSLDITDNTPEKVSEKNDLIKAFDELAEIYKNWLSSL